MALVETFHLMHLPTSLAVHVALFRDLKNAVYLRQQLLDGNTDFEYALIDANVVSESLVPCREQTVPLFWTSHGYHDEPYVFGCPMIIVVILHRFYRPHTYWRRSFGLRMIITVAELDQEMCILKSFLH